MQFDDNDEDLGFKDECSPFTKKENEVYGTGLLKVNSPLFVENVEKCRIEI